MKQKLLMLLFTLVVTIGMVNAKVKVGDLYYNLDAETLTAEVTFQNSGHPYWSTELRSANIPANINYGGDTYVVTSIGKNAFSGCEKLSDVTIPNTLKSIGEDAFFYCKWLTSIVVPDSVVEIQKRAFDACSNLRSIVIGEGVQRMGEYAFSGCYDLSTVKWNAIHCADFSYLGSPFGGSVSQMILGEKVEHIPAYIFSGTSLTEVIIPSSVITIGNYAFWDCSLLQSVVLGDSVSTIGADAFSECKNLQSVVFGEGLTTIMYGAFEECTALQSVTLGNHVQTIGSGAFRDCSNLNSLSLPSSLLTIDWDAFYGCSRLFTVDIPDGVTTIGSNAFKDVKHITYNGTASGAPWGAQHMNNYVEGFFIYYDASKMKLLVCSREIEGDVLLPNSLISIFDGAFSDCDGLTSIVIPDNITTIGARTFSNCTNLTSVSMPNHIKTINNYAFYGCSSLVSFTLPDSLSGIGNYAFEDCRQLSIRDIPNSVTKIGEEAFYNCLVDTLFLGENVYSIGKNAFGNRYGSSIKYVRIKRRVPPSMYGQDLGWSSVFGDFQLVVVPFGCLDAYATHQRWKLYNLHVLSEIKFKNSSTSISAVFGSADEQKHIVSCGIEEGEDFAGNVIEFIGLEPDSEYVNVPFYANTNEGDHDTTSYSFTTPALELTTKESKPVSSTTAILLAETNMADAETSCGFEYKRYDAPEDMKGTKVYCPVSNGVMAGRLKNLKDDVYYKYRAFYLSAKGNMYYGEWQYIFTGDVAVEFDPILYTYEAVAVTESTATLKGYAIAGAEDFTEQGFEYWADSRVPQANNAPARMFAALGEHKTVQASGIKMQVTLTDLDAGTVYKYRTYAKVGDQVCYGSEMSFTTNGVYQGEEGIELIPANLDTTSRKILYNGQIFILRGDKIYTITGQEVR